VRAKRQGAGSVYLVRRNPSTSDLLLWGGGLALVALALWKGKELATAVTDAVVDVVKRGKRLTFAGMGFDGVVPINPATLCAAASAVLGREVSQAAYDMARMIRSEGAAAGRVRAHVALNDAAELGWSLHSLLTYSTSSRTKGMYGEQSTPASRAPGGIKSTRRYSTAADPYEGDVQVAEQAMAEHAMGVDPTSGAVKFVDKASLSVQEGARTYESIVASWGGEGLRPFNVYGYSDDLVVFRRVG
jgi:hypothetical protein